MKHSLVCELELQVPRDEVFAFFSSPFNLHRITPDDVHFRILTPAPVELRAGTRINYQINVFGIPFRWRTVFTVWEPPVRFVDVQESGPYRLWVHSHSFAERNGKTVVRDDVEYELPLQPLGEIAHGIVRRKLDRIFAFRQQQIRRILSPPGSC